MATTTKKKPRAQKKLVQVVGTTRRERSVKSGTISTGFGIEQGGGSSQQIPQEVIEKMANDIVEPPLGPRSFEEFAALLLDSTEFASCVYQTAIDVAGGGWHLSPMNQDEEMDDEEIDVATAFLEAPNPNAKLGDIIKSTVIDYRTIGNAWIEVLRQNNDPNGLPSGLAHAPGLAMRINANLQGFVMLSRAVKKVAYFRPLFSDPKDPTSLNPRGRDKKVLNEMIFFRDYHPASPWYGVPSIVPAMRAIKGSVLSSERNIRFFTNRAFPEYVVTLEGETDNVSEPDMLALEEDIKNHFANLLRGEDYKTFMTALPAGVTLKLEKLGIDFNDETLRQYRIDNRDEVVRSQRMMPNRIGIIESGNIGGGSGESQIEIYKSSLIKPLQEMFEVVIDSILHSDRPIGFGLKTVRWKCNEIDTIDEFREAQIAAVLASTGWLRIEEGRKYLTQFVKVNLEEIDEPWAELPLQLLLPQLAEFFEPLESELQEEPGITPGVSAFGTPEIGPQIRSMNGPGRQVPTGALKIAVDKAYRRFRDRQEQDAKVVADVSTNGGTP